MLDAIWANDLQLPAFPRLERDIRTDVLIIGGGMAGILCAYTLSKEGISYALIEADRICNGVTRNTTAKITSQHGLIYHKLLRTYGDVTARRYWEANEWAICEYRRLAQSIDCDYQEQDNYIYSTEPDDLAAEMAALKRLGIPAQFIRDLPLPVYAAGAVKFSGQAQFHPLKLVAGIVQGLHIYEHTPAREFAGDTVITDHGNIRAKRIIVTTHFPILNKHGGYFLKQYQERSYVIALEGAEKVDGMYLGEGKEGLSFRSYGDLLLLDGGSHRTGKKGGGWRTLEAFAKAHYPNAQEVCRWAAQDCMTLDGMPYIGQYGKNTPALFVTTGFNKWGMTTSMVAARILSQLVQGREDPYAEVFSPSRSSLHPQLFCNMVESAMNILRPTVPRCPHLGCALRWNEMEHSWDCPCHGSRFSEDGTLLDGPATDDLDLGK